MTKVIGVRFKNTGRLYYFAPGDLDIKAGMHVIVETARGVEYGMAVSGVREIEDEKVPQGGLRPVLRIADTDDAEQAARNREKEREAVAVCKEKIRAHGLDMKLIDAEYTFDNNKVLFYFTADGRVDFRELVKDLAGVLRTRIELRQIGVRDETKILGGIGICGRALCCHSYLTDFVPVSIRMAKEQNLSLNPTKISGVCGRLMCCLKNEEATYEYLNSRLPRYGETVTTPTGRQGTVSELNVLRQRVKVVIEENDTKEIQEFEVDDLKFRPRRPKGADAGAKADKGEKGEKTGRSERNDRQEKSDRQDRPDRQGRADRQDRSDRQGHADRQDRSDRPEKAAGGADKAGASRNHENDRRRRRRPQTGESFGEKEADTAAEGVTGEEGSGERRRSRRRHNNRGPQGLKEGAEKASLTNEG